MRTLNRVGGLLWTSLLSVILATSASAQHDSKYNKSFSQKSLIQTGSFTWKATRQGRRNVPSSARLDRYSDLATKHIPFLFDTNGRKCMGFGRLFPIVGSHNHPENGLNEQRVADRELRRLGEAMVERSTDDFRSDSEMPAGYTFLAQFIDHDITFDTTSMLNRPLRDDEFQNSRSVALDLDSVYGRGPEQDPYLYNLPYLRIGSWIGGCGSNARFDLLRVNRNDAPGPHGGAARALIGDPRNDENFIIAQLHSAFITFHNRIVDLLIVRQLNRSEEMHCDGHRNCDLRRFATSLPLSQKQELFDLARDHVIHYYHRIIMEDFLPRLIGEARLHALLRGGRSFFFPNGFSKTTDGTDHPFIPVEFAVAAFRYGHSQVRERYQLRNGVRTKLLDAVRRSNGGSPAFQPVNSEHLVDWRFFFPITRDLPRGFNRARRIDPDIAPFLHDLGRSRVVDRNDVVSLPARNLSRGKTFRLPSGQAIAARMLPALYNRGLMARVDSSRASRSRSRGPAWSLFVLRPDQRTRSFIRNGQTPLWYYILQEADRFGGPSEFGAIPTVTSRYQRRNHIRYASTSDQFEQREAASPRRSHKYGVRHFGGHTLGPIGGTLVGEVLTGLLEHYRIKTGKGLSFRPLLNASTKGNHLAPLSLTSIPHVNRGYFGRYLMRNLIIDVGQDRPISASHSDNHECRYRYNENLIGSRQPLSLPPEQNSTSFQQSERYANPRKTIHHPNSGAMPLWAKKAFEQDLEP